MSPSESGKHTRTNDVHHRPGGSRPYPGSEPARRTPITWQAVLRLMLLALVLLFAVLNTQTITLHLIFTTLEMPLFVVIFGSVALGAIIVLLDARRRRRRIPR